VPQSDLVFSKAAVTRISHDLAGVISAVSNSLALLDELGGADQETLKLAMDNADILMKRLRFFRAVFGNEGPLSDMDTARRILEEYLSTLENRAVHYECIWKTDRELPIFVFRLILLGGMIVADTLPRGGKITVYAEAGSHCVRFEAEGRTAVDPLLVSIAEGTYGDVPTPKIVPAVFLQKCLSEQGWSMSVSEQDEKVVIRLGEKERQG